MMDSNENAAMERNDVLSELNILICYMHESELRMQSYGAMNMSTWIGIFRDLDEKQPPVYGFQICTLPEAFARVLAGTAPCSGRRW